MERVDGKHRLYIEKKKLKFWQQVMEYIDSEYPKPVETYPGQDQKFFFDKYGNLPGRKKASTKTSVPVMKEQVKIRKINEAIVKIMEEKNEMPPHKQLVEMLGERTFCSLKKTYINLASSKTSIS